jgi:type IV fimbrial biogenesis protein FimT
MYRSTLRAQRGFNLTELLVALLIAVILGCLAAPSMVSMMAAHTIRTGGTDLMSALLLARSEAIKRNAQVVVRPLTGSDWTKGWVVAAVATGEQYDRKNALGNDVTVHRAPVSVVYDHNGRIVAEGPTRLEFADVWGRAPARCVAVDLSGMPRLVNGSCA